MRVRIEAEVLADPTQFGRDIGAILERCILGQHRWVIDNLEDVLSSSWMKSCPSWMLTPELAMKAFDEQIYEPTSTPRERLLIVSLAPQVRGSAQDKVETPPSARKLLEQAVQLLLENSTADWHFVRAIARIYSREELRQAIDKKWIVPAHAGGKGEFRKRFDELTDRGVPPWRIAVLMDSDRLVPGPLPAESEKKRKQLEELGVKVFSLHKREAENYLPPPLLDSDGRRETYVSFLALSREQQDHFDMKEGFKKNKRGEIEPRAEQASLFGNVTAWHKKRLAGGFGSSIGDRFKDATIAREEMDEVCSTRPGELEEILLKLEEML